MDGQQLPAVAHVSLPDWGGVVLTSCGCAEGRNGWSSTECGGTAWYTGCAACASS
jgi:hypothetical protein